MKIAFRFLITLILLLGLFCLIPSYSENNQSSLSEQKNYSLSALDPTPKAVVLSLNDLNGKWKLIDIHYKWESLKDQVSINNDKDYKTNGLTTNLYLGNIFEIKNGKLHYALDWKNSPIGRKFLNNDQERSKVTMNKDSLKLKIDNLTIICKTNDDLLTQTFTLISRTENQMHFSSVIGFYQGKPVATEEIVIERVK